VAQQISVGKRTTGINAFDYHPVPDDGGDGEDEFEEHLEADRHLGGSNYLFADGHAKWYRFEQTLNPGPANVGMHNINNLEIP